MRYFVPFFSSYILSSSSQHFSFFSPTSSPLVLIFLYDLLSLIGIAGINMGGGYLLDYQQLTRACGCTTEENDSRTLNRHRLSIASQDRLDLMRPSSSHDEMLRSPIMCKRLLFYKGIHVLSLSDYEHFCNEHH